jgi:hypothetical protein
MEDTTGCSGEVVVRRWSCTSHHVVLSNRRAEAAWPTSIPCQIGTSTGLLHLGLRLSIFDSSIYLYRETILPMYSIGTTSLGNQRCSFWRIKIVITSLAYLRRDLDLAGNSRYGRRNDSSERVIDLCLHSFHVPTTSCDTSRDICHAVGPEPIKNQSCTIWGLSWLILAIPAPWLIRRYHRTVGHKSKSTDSFDESSALSKGYII